MKSDNVVSCYAFYMFYVILKTYLNKSSFSLIIFSSNTSPVTTVCVNAQLKKERKSQISNGDNKVQSGERTNHSIEQNMIAEKGN